MAHKIRTATRAKCCGCATTAQCRATTRSLDAPAANRKCIPSATGTRWVSPFNRAPATSGRTRMARMAATKSTSSVLVVTMAGRSYPGPKQSEQPWREAFEQPIVFWVPSIAVSGMTFYTGNRLPKWKGDVFVGSMRTGEIPGTGHLERILFNEKMEELRRESLLAEMRQRIRDVRQGPDELLYLLTDADDGGVLRIEPEREN